MAVKERDFALMQEVLAAFQAEGAVESGSIRAVAQKFGITRTKVRKILVTLGALSSPLPDEAVTLRDAGLTVQQIAVKLGLATSTVSTYMPYATVLYKGEERSANALRIQGFRQKLDAISRVQLGKAGKPKDAWPAPIRSSRALQEGDKESLGIFKEQKQQETTMECKQEARDVMKLHLELDTEGLNPEDWDILQKYGDVNKEISRDILVPAEMTLHALHYVILQSFGWLNGHLHHFTLQEKDMQSLTSENLRKFLDWVGLYFRFPIVDDEDIYWDDNYQGDISFRNWLRKKYTAPFCYGGKCEHFMLARKQAMEFIRKEKNLQVPPSFQEWLAKGKTQGERTASTKQLDDVSLDEAQRLFEEPLGQLLERLTLAEILGCPDGWREYASTWQKEAIIHYQNNLPRLEQLLQDQRDAAWLKAHPNAKSLRGKPVASGQWLLDEIVSKHMLQNELRQMNPKAVPIANKIHYEYDYGDGWEVTISCEEIFKQGDRRERSPEVSEQLYQVRKTGKPLCMAMDGKRLLDNVGGIGGYCNFLRTINGNDTTAKQEMREWARSLDWTGRRCKPDKLL